MIQIKIYLLIWTTLGVCLQQSEKHYIKQPTHASLNFLLQPKKCTHFPFCSHSQIINLVIIESQHTYIFFLHLTNSNLTSSALIYLSFPIFAICTVVIFVSLTLFAPSTWSNHSFLLVQLLHLHCIRPSHDATSAILFTVGATLTWNSKNNVISTNDWHVVSSNCNFEAFVS